MSEEHREGDVISSNRVQILKPLDSENYIGATQW